MKLTDKEINSIAQDLECSFTCYINKDTKEIRAIIDHQNYTVEEEYWKEDLDKLKAEWPNYVKIEPMSTNEAYVIMQDFALQVNHPKLAEKLTKALKGPNVFRLFRNIVEDDFDLRDDWIKFKIKKYEDWVRNYLEQVESTEEKKKQEEDTTTVNVHEKKMTELIEILRPPKDIRHELDISFTFNNYEIIIFEDRPRFDKKKVIESSPFAKAKFIKSKQIWKIYWLRSNGKWEHYKSDKEVKELIDFIKLVDDDDYGCFMG